MNNDSHTSAARPKLLVVDDSRTECRRVGYLAEQLAGVQVLYAFDGAEALARLSQEQPDAVLTDLQMPQVNGLELTQRIREEYPHIPVVLMTAQGSEEVAYEALRAGAASYLPKALLDRELGEVLQQVLTASRRDRQRRCLMACLKARHSRYVLDNDPALIPEFIRILQEDLDAIGLFDQSSRIRVAVALEEALLNALYHGNLECSSELRQEDDRRYHQLAEQRRQQEPYRSRRLFVEAEVTEAAARFVIRDQGPGFDPASLPDPTDPMNLGRASGRGLLLIRTFMDEVTHNATGNEIRLLKRRTAPRREEAAPVRPETAPPQDSAASDSSAGDAWAAFSGASPSFAQG
jgi:CheY-like chemotaxis protein/anti-sigma regulatory factor (Ser/Thr protein kinase)